MNRKFKDTIAYTLIYASVITVIGVLIAIFGWVFINGIDGLSLDFITSSAMVSKSDVEFESGVSYDFDYEYVTSDGDPYYELVLDEDIETSNVYNGDMVEIKDQTVIEDIDGVTLTDVSEEEADALIEQLKEPTSDTTVRLMIPATGIRELILTTLFVVFFSLLFALPIGLFSAIYLVEYDINPKVNKIVHFAIDSLSGIPSIIFGLFGALFFGLTLGLGQSLLAGILTVSIMLLPIIIKSIEETLIAVPNSFREASYGLGATKTQTLFKVIIPSATPGILVAIILAMGRVIGESAIFIFVVGTATALPSLLGKGATLTVNMYATSRESLDIDYVASLALILFIMILVLNISAKLIVKKIGGKK